MQKTRTVIALVLPVLVIGGVWATRSNAQDTPKPSAEQQTRIPAPEVWVPFTAELRQVKPRPDAEPLIVVGRFYRSSNGNQRTESGPETEPARVVDIKNITRGLYFTTARDQATGKVYWVEQPMKLPAGGWKPPQMGEAADRRLIKDKFDGRQVVSVVSGPGMMTLMAPELNFYPMVKTYVLTGERTEAHVTSTEEPAADLFEPPAGAEIRRTDKPSGIVFETREPNSAERPPVGKPHQP